MGRLRSIGNRLRAGGSGFSPAQISFTSGLWLDQSDISTGFTDSGGTTPQTASGQLTGLRLDKSRGLALGSELVTVAADRDFSSDTGFWSKDAGVAISAGAANWSATAAIFQLYRTLFLTVGKYYEVTYSVTAYTQGGIKLGGGLSGTTRSAVGTYTERLCAASSTFSFASVGASTTLSIDNVSIKEVTGNHVLQATSSARPEYDVISGISSDYMDGLDDGYGLTFSAGTLVNGMDLFIAVKRSATDMVLCSMSAANYIMAMTSAGATAATVNAGTVTHWVNGVQVTGGTATTEAQLYAAVTAGQWKVVEAQGLNLSAWTGFRVSLFTSFIINGDVGGLILCPTQTDPMRAKIRTWLGAKVGISI